MSLRKAVAGVIHEKNSLLLYPVQYEGLEQNPHILYSGSCLNEQIVPAIDWCVTKGLNKVFLIGSDYVFPRTANTLVKSILTGRGGRISGEEYLPLDATDFSAALGNLKSAAPDIVFNTINGASNSPFFAGYSRLGIKCPVISFSIPEHDLQNLCIPDVEHYLCWSYFRELPSEANKKFIRDYDSFSVTNPIASDPVVMAYSQIQLWSQAVEIAQSLAFEDVVKHLPGQKFHSPAGLLEVMTNNHLLKYAYIGRQTSRTNVEVIWKSHRRWSEPQPWLGLENTHLPSAGLIQDALSQYTNLIQTNVDLQLLNNEQKKELSESRMLLDAIVESTEDYIWTIGTESLEITWFNQRFYDYFLTKRGIRMHKGMRPEELFETEAYIRMWHDFYTRTLEKGSFSTEYETVKGVNILPVELPCPEKRWKGFRHIGFWQGYHRAKTARTSPRGKRGALQGCIHDRN